MGPDKIADFGASSTAPLGTIMVFRRFPVSVACVATLVALAGCGGGSSESAGGSSDSEDGTTGDVGISYVTDFDDARVSQIRNDPEFLAQDVDVTLTSPSFVLTYDRQSYASINLQYALSTGLTGAGQTIAVLDSGFLTTHQEFAGKSITVYSNSTDMQHGTGVAAIATGAWNGVGMMGVAPGANLHLSSINTTLADLGPATDSARLSGAIVQNNSWGLLREGTSESVSVSEVQSYQATNPGVSLSEALTAVMGYSASDFQTYLDALNLFTDSGVVVRAVSNGISDTSADLLAALPELDSRLADSWITAINVAPNHDPSGAITSVTRLSAGCLETAAYCLAADGTVYTATADSNSSYGYNTGSSFSAPQISGGVALLAEAFPSLRPDELVDRLLASANNSFFTPTQVVDFGNDVTHSYNSEFGHGFMDLRAALLPIGRLGLAATSQSDGGTVPLSTAVMQTGAAHGNALQAALADQRVALFDGLGTDFYVSASVLVSEDDQSDAFQDRVDRFASIDTAKGSATPAGFGYAASGDTALGIDGVPIFGWAEDIGAEFGIVPLSSEVYEAPTSLLGLADNAQGFGTAWKLPDGNLGFYGFADMTEPFEQTIGFGLVRAFNFGDGGSISVGLSGVGETGSFLGLSLAEDGGFGATSTAFNTGVTLPAGRFQLFATAELGVSQAEGGGLVTDIDPSFFSGFSIGARTQQVFNRRDSLTVSVRQPMRLEAGTATIRLSTGRTLEGQVLYTDIEAELEPEARQLDLGFDYVTALSPATNLRFGAAASFNEGHEAGEIGGTVMAAIAHRF